MRYCVRSDAFTAGGESPIVVSSCKDLQEVGDRIRGVVEEGVKLLRYAEFIPVSPVGILPFGVCISDAGSHLRLDRAEISPEFMGVCRRHKRQGLSWG